MGFMEKLKQVAKGRSGMVEKGVDSAVDQVSKVTKGKYDDKLTKGAAQVKEQARRLDDERVDPPAGDPPSPPVGDEGTRPPA